MTPRTKKATEPTEPKKIVHRTADERVAALQAEIERIRTRDAAKQVRRSDDGKALLIVTKALDKAASTATAAGNRQMVQALERARAPLSELLVEMGSGCPRNAGDDCRPSRLRGLRGREGRADGCALLFVMERLLENGTEDALLGRLGAEVSG